MAQAKPNTKVNTQTAPVENNGRKTVEVPAEMQTMINGFAADMTTSAKIRTLLGAGYSRSQVAKGLGILYQHVRNVEITPLKKG